MSDPRLAHNLFHVPPIAAVRDASAAIIVLDDGRYLMQHRDDKPDIFFPAHWGLFGGAIEKKETPETALRRELQEELGLTCRALRYFTTMNFNFDSLGAGPVRRVFFELQLPVSAVRDLCLGEGRAMQAFTAAELLLDKRVVPYDAFALWMHFAPPDRNLKPQPIERKRSAE